MTGQARQNAPWNPRKHLLLPAARAEADGRCSPNGCKPPSGSRAPCPPERPPRRRPRCHKLQSPRYPPECQEALTRTGESIGGSNWDGTGWLPYLTVFHNHYCISILDG